MEDIDQEEERGTYRLEDGLGHMSPWIQRDDLVLLIPAWTGGDLKWWVRVGVIWFMVWIQGVHCDC